MNEKEIAEINSIWQAVNDTSDFHRWQNSRRSAGLSMDYESWQEVRDSVLAWQKAHADEGDRNIAPTLNGCALQSRQNRTLRLN